MTMPPEGLDHGNGGIWEWAELYELLVRGLVHALNNRITALSAYSQLVCMGDAEITPGDVLPEELAQLSLVSDHLRVLGAERLAPEAVELRPVLDESIGLHRHHPRLRAVHCDVMPMTSLYPVRVPRWALSRLLLVLIEHGKRAADRAGRNTLTIVIEGSEATVELRVASDGTPSPYAETMAALCGATITVEDDETVLLLPTLLEVRRRELAARG